MYDGTVFCCQKKVCGSGLAFVFISLSFFFFSAEWVGCLFQLSAVCSHIDQELAVHSYIIKHL